MKFKKVLSTTALAGILAISLASCGGGENTGGTGGTTDTGEIIAPQVTTVDPTTLSGEIQFVNSIGDTNWPTVQTAIDNFQAKYPNWTITSVQPGGYDDIYSSNVNNITAGTAPDLSYCYADHVASYLESGKVLDLNAFIYNRSQTVTEAVGGTSVSIGYTDEEIADFVPGYYNEGLATKFANYDIFGYLSSGMLILPFSKSTELLYYNKTALNQLGIEVPTTWDEMWAACKTVKAQYPNSHPLVYDSEANWFINTCEQNGWDYTVASGNAHYQFDNENTRNWLTTLKGYYDEGLFHTATTADVNYTSSLFTTGASECVFCIGSSAGASYQDPDGAFEWGVAPVPGASGDNGKVISQGPSLVMFDQGDSDEANAKEIMTWLFMKELLSAETQASFSMTSGYNPVRTSSFSLPAYAEFLADTTNIKAVAANTASSLTNNFYTSAVFNGSATARTQVGSALVYAVTGQKTAEKALSDAVQQCGGNF